MQVFCERFLRFMAGERVDLNDPDGCSCSRPIPRPMNQARAAEEDSRLEPFRRSTRITAS
jgi:hypothetical protein